VRPGHSFCHAENALPLPRGIYDFYPECDKVKDGKRALTIYIYINYLYYCTTFIGATNKH